MTWMAVAFAPMQSMRAVMNNSSLCFIIGKNINLLIASRVSKYSAYTLFSSFSSVFKSDFILVVTPKAAKGFCLATRPGPFWWGRGKVAELVYCLTLIDWEPIRAIITSSVAEMEAWPFMALVSPSFIPLTL